MKTPPSQPKERAKVNIPSFEYTWAVERYVHSIEAIKEYLDGGGEDNLEAFARWCLKKIPTEKAKVTRKWNKMQQLFEANK